MIPRLFFKSRGQIGDIASDLTEELAPLIDSGNRLEAKVLNVVGGENGRSDDVNVELEAIAASRSRNGICCTSGRASIRVL